MKDLLINSAMNNVEKNCNYDSDELAIIRYGLASLYLTITKTIVIFSISYIIGDIKALLILMLLYSILRLSGFGVHATKSWHCWISSLIAFLLLPHLCSNIIINYNLGILIGIICEILLILYSPADTEKRPLISKKRRIVFKIITSINGLIYLILFLIVKNNLLSNCLLFSLIIESIVILPITYKLFGAKYNNYKHYKKE